MHNVDTTPENLVGILDQFNLLFPYSKEGPMGLITVDHSMDEIFLDSMLRERKRLCREKDNTPTATLYFKAEVGLLEFLMSLPDDLRQGVGRWSPIHPVVNLPGTPPADGDEVDDLEPPDEKIDIDELVHPDDAEVEAEVEPIE